MKESKKKTNAKNNTFEKIYKIVSLIPSGKVLTYKRVAQLSSVNNPRIIGYALHSNKNPSTIPCHRVVKSDGTLASGYAFGGKEEQIRKLKQEGVEIIKNVINLQKYLY